MNLSSIIEVMVCVSLTRNMSLEKYLQNFELADVIWSPGPIEFSNLFPEIKKMTAQKNNEVRTLVCAICKQRNKNKESYQN